MNISRFGQSVALVLLLPCTPVLSALVIAGPTLYNERIDRVGYADELTVLFPNVSAGFEHGVSYLRSSPLDDQFSLQGWADALNSFNANPLVKAPWSFNFKGKPIDGTLNVDVYQAARVDTKDAYGARLDLTFALTSPDFALNDIRFLQRVRTNYPLLPLLEPVYTYIDPLTPDDVPGGDKEELPFYWTAAQEAGQKNAAAKTYKFTDFSSRDFVADTFWEADLMFAVWHDVRDAQGFVVNRNVDIYDGIRWGWRTVDEPKNPAALALALLFAWTALRARRRAADRRKLRGPRVL